MDGPQWKSRKVQLRYGRYHDLSGHGANGEKKKAIDIPDELKKVLTKNKKLNTQFAALTPFKQREYIEYIGEAKQEKTRIARVEKSVPLILNGIGLNDKYR